jgi:hypothetical protein
MKKNKGILTVSRPVRASIPTYENVAIRYHIKKIGMDSLVGRVKKDLTNLLASLFVSTC